MTINTADPTKLGFHDIRIKGTLNNGQFDSVNFRIEVFQCSSSVVTTVPIASFSMDKSAGTYTSSPIIWTQTRT